MGFVDLACRCFAGTVALTFLCAGLLEAQAVPSVGPGTNAQEAQAQNPEPAAAPAETPNFYVEASGLWNRFRPSGDTWQGGEARIMYSGFKRLTPYASFATLNNDTGTQTAASTGSYIRLHKYFYTIVGAAVAPNIRILFFPRARFDAAGFVSIPSVKGLVVSAGVTEIRPYRNADGGRIFSVGGIYYTRVGIFSGNVNLDESLPSGLRSTSGQFAVMHGAQGKYWLTAGIGGGHVAY